jgi:hypothetical protein
MRIISSRLQVLQVSLWPLVVAYAFAFRIITFVSDHMPCADPKPPLKTPSKAQQGQRSQIALCFGIY